MDMKRPRTRNSIRNSPVQSLSSRLTTNVASGVTAVFLLRLLTKLYCGIVHVRKLMDDNQVSSTLKKLVEITNQSAMETDTILYQHLVRFTENQCTAPGKKVIQRQQYIMLDWENVKVNVK